MGPHYVESTFSFDTAIICLKVVNIYPLFVSAGAFAPSRIVISGLLPEIGLSWGFDTMKMKVNTDIF